MLQLKSLSGDNDLTFLGSEPGFANIQITGDHSDKWPTTVYCLTHKGIANKDTHKVCGSRCENTVKVLDASAVQKQFRALTDRILICMTLPTNWEHGCFLRPRFGGFRKHGPATLYQFVWTAPDGHVEIKVNMDITLSIKLPTPTNTSPFQFDIFRRFPETNSCVKEITSFILNDPGLAIIPLYSNFMIATGKADKKYSWKVSCSRVEHRFLSSFSDASLLKTLIRVLKIIRDDHLTKRNTQDQKQSEGDGVDSEGDMNFDQLLDSWTHDTEKSTTDVDDDSLLAVGSIKGLLDDQIVDIHEVEHRTNDFGENTETYNNLRDIGAKTEGQTNIDVHLGHTSRINMEADDNLSGCNPSTADSSTRIEETECVLQRDTDSADILDNETTDCEQTHRHGFENITVHGDGKTSTTRMTEEICDATRSGAQKHELNQQAINAKIADNEPAVEPLSKPTENQTQNAATTDDITQSNSSSPGFMETEGDSSKVSRSDDTGMSKQSIAERIADIAYQAKFLAEHRRYQTYDIGQERVILEPGSEEYYGARQYISSVEIKFMAMKLVLSPASFPEVFKRDAEPESLAEYVLSSLENFRKIFEIGDSTRSLYYWAPTCTPLSPEKRQMVLNQIATILLDLVEEAEKHDKDEEEYV